MGKAIEKRAPLSEEEVLNYLNQKVEAEERHWGVDYIYARWARENRDKQMEKFRAGEVVPVLSISYVDKYGNGSGDYEDTLYSDGHVETACFGYLDQEVTLYVIKS